MQTIAFYLELFDTASEKNRIKECGLNSLQKNLTITVSFREDESRIRRDNGAEVMSMLRRLTLNLLKANTSSKASMKRKRKIAIMDDTLRSDLVCPVI